MCKKVSKYEEGQTSFKNMQNIIKEFEVLCRIDHPSLCKAIGINMQEKYPADNSYNDNEENPTTTIAIFIDFQPYKLKDCLEQKILNNTLKAKIAVEVCFGMSYIHRLGMIHRDLKIENIMLNCIFEAKIIDFDLVHVGINSVSQSLTKGIGTLAYMSPEMMNEEDYDYKTDVYSFGVVLYVMFVGHLPKQSMRDKLTNKPLSFPSPSQSISSYCISIIKKCLAFEPSERPTFDEILEDMKCHSFDLASEIQPEMVLKRYKELAWLKTQNY